MISFILPTLNEEKIIEKTLNNLLRYTGDKEIIVSDGGSIDSTVEIARGLADHVVVHTKKSRQTIAEGRNEGASIAQGDYIVFIDADMYFIDPDTFFQKAISVFQKNTNIVGLTVKLKVLPEFETISDTIVFTTVNYLFYIQNNIIGSGAAAGEFQMIRRTAFNSVGGYNPSLVVGEDNEFFKRLSKVGKTHFENSLVIYHTGRRAHTIGWPKLLYQWVTNIISVSIRKRSATEKWEEIR